jgi:chemotaxis protein histidine kinase CheA
MISVEREFRDLQKLFLRGTGERLEEMARDLKRLDRGAERKQAASALYRHVHALAGLGASYGYPEISWIGESGERLADELMTTAEASSADALFLLGLIVESFHDALSRTPEPS